LAGRQSTWAFAPSATHSDNATTTTISPSTTTTTTTTSTSRTKCKNPVQFPLSTRVTNLFVRIISSFRIILRSNNNIIFPEWVSGPWVSRWHWHLLRVLSPLRLVILRAATAWMRGRQTGCCWDRWRINATSFGQPQGTGWEPSSLRKRTGRGKASNGIVGGMNGMDIG